jgi:hypothetical protein
MLVNLEELCRRHILAVGPIEEAWMKSRTKRYEQASTRVLAVISACMMIVMSLPACTTGAMSSARLPVQNQLSPVGQQIDVLPVSEPVVFGDETSKSLPVEQDEEPAGACSDALYIEEPMASGYVQVSEGLWKICNDQLKTCTIPCNRKRSDAAKAKCFEACNKQYYACLSLAGLTKMTFDALDKAWSWIKNNKAKIAGTIIIVGGVAYIVSTSGTGALILIPLAG